MSSGLVTVEQAAEQLKLHPKTVLRYIRASVDDGARATCIVDIPSLEVESAERISMLLNAAAMTGDAQTPRLHISTAFDPTAKTLKVVVVGRPSDAARLLEMVELQLGSLS